MVIFLYYKQKAEKIPINVTFCQIFVYLPPNLIIKKNENLL